MPIALRPVESKTAKSAREPISIRPRSGRPSACAPPAVAIATVSGGAEPAPVPSIREVSS